MKKWKRIMLSAVLCMTIGMQAVAAEPNVPADMAEVESEAVDVQESVADEPEKTQTQEQDAITVNLPIYNNADLVEDGAEAYFTNCTLTFSDNSTAEFAGNVVRDAIWWRITPSQRTISQEEAKKIIGTQEECTIIAVDAEVCLNKEYNSSIYDNLNNKTIEKIQATGFRIQPTIGEDWMSVFSSAHKRETSLKVLYSPNPSVAFTEVTVGELRGSESANDFGGLKGDIPFKGATLVFIAGKPSTSSETSSSSSSGSSSRPEVYSRGETVGDIGVQKTGTAAHVRKADGTEVNVIVHPYLNPGTKTLTQSQARAMLGTSYACGIYSFDLAIVNAQEDYGPVTLLDGSVPVTFIVPGVTPESKVALRHWINGSNTYEDLPVEVGNGTVKATFTSFSPVVIVVEQPGVTAPADGVKSPKTGENSVVYMAEMIALLSLAGLVFSRKRRQA